MNAKEARELAFKNNKRLERFFDWIKKESERYNLTKGFYACERNSYDDIDDFTEDELNYIRELGYNIFWDRAMLEYEVNWG